MQIDHYRIQSKLENFLPAARTEAETNSQTLHGGRT